MIFDPYPPTVGSFLLLSYGKFGKFLTPAPLRDADVLNEWSLRFNIKTKTQNLGKEAALPALWLIMPLRMAPNM